MGYIHTTSLRWALKREHCLFFNSNLRHLITSQQYTLYRWYISVLWGFCMSICYAATPLLTHTSKPHHLSPHADIVGVRVTSFVFLSIGIFGQAANSFWCLLKACRNIRTWNSNPLNTTLVCLKDGMERIPGRCLQPIHSSNLPAGSFDLSMRQVSVNDLFRLRSVSYTGYGCLCRSFQHYQSSLLSSKPSCMDPTSTRIPQ